MAAIEAGGAAVGADLVNRLLCRLSISSTAPRFEPLARAAVRLDGVVVGHVA